MRFVTQLQLLQLRAKAELAFLGLSIWYCSAINL